MTEQVTIERAGGILTLALNRPEKKNAITGAMYKALYENIEAAKDDPEVRCVLIRAEGADFSSGNDVFDFAAIATGQIKPEDAGAWRLLETLAHFDKPIVAAVKGLAVGIGTTLLLHCDLVYVAEDAKLSTPFVNLALAPEAASSVILPTMIGHARAFSMFVLGEPVSGRDAAAWGLANKALPAEDVDAAARAAAELLVSRPINAVRASKRLMRDGAKIWAQMEAEGRVFNDLLFAPEAREAFTAFAERRKPDFSKVA